MQIIKATADNTRESGIRAEREGNSFNPILGGHRVSPEPSRSCCCHPLATLKICCTFIGLKTKLSAGLSAHGFPQSRIRFFRVLMTEPSLAFPCRAPLAGVAEPSVPGVFQKDGASGGRFWGSRTHHLRSLITA